MVKLLQQDSNLKKKKKENPRVHQEKVLTLGSTLAGGGIREIHKKSHPSIQEKRTGTWPGRKNAYRDLRLFLSGAGAL